MSLLGLQEVSKGHGKGPAEIHAVQDIDLPVDAGALVAVMGPSASGKSTPPHHRRQLAAARLTELAALVNPEGAPKQ